MEKDIELPENFGRNVNLSFDIRASKACAWLIYQEHFHGDREKECNGYNTLMENLDHGRTNKNSLTMLGFLDLVMKNLF